MKRSGQKKMAFILGTILSIVTIASVLMKDIIGSSEVELIRWLSAADTSSQSQVSADMVDSDPADGVRHRVVAGHDGMTEVNPPYDITAGDDVNVTLPADEGYEIRHLDVTREDDRGERYGRIIPFELVDGTEIGPSKISVSFTMPNVNITIYCKISKKEVSP